MKKLLLLSISLFFCLTSLFSQYWEDLTSLANPPNLPQMVACDGKIYVVSGRENNQAPATWEYNPASDQWTEKAKIPQACFWSTAVSVNGKIYVMGGGQPYPGKSYNLIYDPKTDSWSAGADLLTPRMYHSSASVNNKIYLIGGQNGDGTTEWYFDEYDPALDSWTRKSPSPRNGAWYCGAVGIGDYFYRIAGGGSSLALTRDYFDRYEVSTNTWTDMGHFRIPLHAPAAVNYQGKIILMGGYSYTDYRDTIYVYDPAIDAWDRMEFKLPQPRSYHKAAVIDDCIYVYGGQDASVAGTLIRHCDPYLGVGKTAFEDMELIIYPNPVKDHVGININSVENTLGDFLIMDMIGKAMIRKTEMIRAGNNQIDIHAANLSEGMYILNMTIGDKLISKKLVK